MKVEPIHAKLQVIYIHVVSITKFRIRVYIKLQN